MIAFIFTLASEERRKDKYPSQNKMSLRYFNPVFIERYISKNSQKHLKSDDFFVTSLNFQREVACLLRAISETSQKYFLHVFVTFKNAPQKWFRVTSVELLEYLIKEMRVR